MAQASTSSNRSSRPWFSVSENRVQLADGERKVVVVGAGMAGCSIARELADRGFQVTLIDEGPGLACGASANTAAILKPHVSRQPNRVSRFFIRGFERTRRRVLSLQQCGATIDAEFNGVLQLLQHAKDYPPNDCYEYVDNNRASAISGLSLNAGALFFARAGWINTRHFCEALASHPAITLVFNTQILKLNFEKESRLWRLTDSNNRHYQSHCTILANGPGLSAFQLTHELPIVPARGQITRIKRNPQTRISVPVTAKNYLIPTQNGIHVGATFERKETQSSVLDADTRANLAGAQKLLNCTPDALQPCGDWAAVRATTPDRLPITGPLPRLDRYPELYRDLHHGRTASSYPKAEYWPGLYITGGYGSRGTCCTTLCAELLASEIELHQEDVSQQHLQDLELLHPSRFLIRQLRKPDRTNKKNK